MINKGQTIKRTVLITGTTSGIGYELSRIFAAKEFNLVLVSRNEQKLKAQQEDLKKRKGGEVYIIIKDLSDSKAPDEIFSDVQRRGIHVDTGK